MQFVEMLKYLEGCSDVTDVALWIMCHTNLGYKILTDEEIVTVVSLDLVSLDDCGGWKR